MKLKDWIGVMFYIFIILITYVNSCGISTHIDIGKCNYYLRIQLIWTDGIQFIPCLHCSILMMLAAYRAMAFFNYTTSNTDYRQVNIKGTHCIVCSSHLIILF